MVTAHANPWTNPLAPRRILVMRFQATGDVVITLPFLQSLKSTYPVMQIDFLTRQECAEIPQMVSMFERVIILGGGRNTIIQFLHVLWRLPQLWFHRYELVLDLQNHWISRLVRRFLFVRHWSQFDRRGHHLAGERTLTAIQAAGLKAALILPEIKLKTKDDAARVLNSHGWDGVQPLIILNPGGAFPSRHWPMENYVAFVRLWQSDVNRQTKFIILGLPSMQASADHLHRALGDSLINLCGKTSQTEAFLIVRLASLMLTEDSGLMHMAWVQGVPTLALFGSSPSYWSAPMGEHTLCLHSSDLPCGNCLLERCKFGDNRCLTRYSPEAVVRSAKKLLTPRQ